MENLIFSLNATVPVFLMMVLGYVLRRLKVVDEPFVKTLNSFNYKITLPVLLFRDIAESDFYKVWDTTYVLYCFLATLSCIVIIWVVSHFFCRNKDTMGEFIQASYRGSAAVLGVAYIQNIYGNAGMAPLMIMGTVPLYNIAAVLVLSFTNPSSGGLNKKSLQKSVRGILTKSHYHRHRPGHADIPDTASHSLHTRQNLKQYFRSCHAPRPYRSGRRF